MRTVILFAFTAASVCAQNAELFRAKLYPALEAAQCRACHNDNGVATATRLRFPTEPATPAEIDRFGLRLGLLINRTNPKQSLLVNKPVNRIAHTGGERIKQGSEAESLLNQWAAYLAKLPEATINAASSEKAEAAPEAVRRLTHSQYDKTVRDLLGDQTHPSSQFPKEDFVNGFTNQLEGQSVSPLQAEAYNKAAAQLAQNVFRGGDTHQLIPCKTAIPTCRDQFITTFGLRAFRRPLSTAEIARYSKLHTAETTRTGSFLKGAQLVVEAMLQSPNFLFHLEPGPYRTASSLSYFLWGTMPSNGLLDQAANGQLATKTQIEITAAKMWIDPRAHAAMDDFLTQWLRFDRLTAASRDRRLFPAFTTELHGSMQEETRRLFAHLIWNNQNFMELFTANYSFLNSALAQLYAVAPPQQEFARTDLPATSGRAGILSHASFLTLTSKPAATSPTERGIFVREHFLCQMVPPPPPGVDANLPALTDEKPRSVQQRLGVHLSNPACAGCHKLVDPIGFSMERYDAIGHYRQQEIILIFPTADEVKRNAKRKPTEYKIDINPEGTLQGLNAPKFSSPAELGRILANEPLCQRCIVKQLFRYAVGRHETDADRPVIDAAFHKFQSSQFQFRELIMSLVTSNAFLGTGE